MVGGWRLLVFELVILLVGFLNFAWADDGLISRIKGFDLLNGFAHPRRLRIGMFRKKWKFHRDLPPTPVFAYGISKADATVPGPTIEALHGISTHIEWKNHLPSKHILPWDYTISTAINQTKKGIPTVVHLHGSIDEPESDGHSSAWFTSRFTDTGPAWTKKTYHYHNLQHPGTLWYHDHAMGLTRVNLLAGLVGAFIIRQSEIERPLRLPELDMPLIIFDRSFNTNGSIYMNLTGNNPSIYPQWQPEYFGEAIIVNGKAWPYMIVHCRRYRFRIINASNARFLKLRLSDGSRFIHIGSDSSYNEKAIRVKKLLLAPSEIADIIVDFSKSRSNSVILTNDARYPYPRGDPVNGSNGKVMKFIIKSDRVLDRSKIPTRLIKYAPPNLSSVSTTRYIALHEYKSDTDELVHLYINGKPYEAPVTETPRVGVMEIWYVINLMEDNHPMHIHLGLFVAMEQTELIDLDKFKECMLNMHDAVKCEIQKYAIGKKIGIATHEKG